MVYPKPSKVPEVLEDSWVVISRVISRSTILTTHINGLIPVLVTTPTPKPLNLTPYRPCNPTLVARVAGCKVLRAPSDTIGALIISCTMLAAPYD